MESTAGSRVSERSTLVPAFPDAPTTTILMPRGYPAAQCGNRVSIRRLPVRR
jgi:hypothetical protein